jgi:hypothetical protein
MLVDTLLINNIVIRNRLRSKLNEKTIIELMDSINKIGLEELPCIRWVEEGEDNRVAVLVVGWHRLEAWRRLGHEWIDCRVFDGDEIEARKWEVAENFHRADLTPDERDQHFQEWFKLTGEGKMRTGAHFMENAKLGAGRGNKGGIRDFSREHNVPESTVREALDLVGLDPAAKEQADAAGLTRKERVRVVKAAGEDPERQKAKVRELAAHKAEVAARKPRGRRKQKKSETNKHNQSNVVELALTEDQKFAAWLMERMDQNDFPRVISWLNKCNPKDVITAIRRRAA